MLYSGGRDAGANPAEPRQIARPPPTSKLPAWRRTSTGWPRRAGTTKSPGSTFRVPLTEAQHIRAAGLWFGIDELRPRAPEDVRHLVPAHRTVCRCMATTSSDSMPIAAAGKFASCTLIKVVVYRILHTSRASFAGEVPGTTRARSSRNEPCPKAGEQGRLAQTRGILPGASPGGGDSLGAVRRARVGCPLEDGWGSAARRDDYHRALQVLDAPRSRLAAASSARRSRPRRGARHHDRAADRRRDPAGHRGLTWPQRRIPQAHDDNGLERSGAT